jgi:hypothetical protein
MRAVPLTDAVVVVAQDVHHLLGLRPLRERREALQARADQGDLRPVALEDSIVAGRDDEVRQLPREEAPQAPEALDLPHLLGDPGLECAVELDELGGLLADGVLVPLDAQQRAHPRQQLGAVEGLGDEVVGARVEGRNLLLLAAGRDHQHREGLGGRVLPQAPAHLVAVHPRHEDVQQHDVGLALGHRAQGLLAGGRRRHLVPLGTEDGLEQPDVGRRVVHHQYPARPGHPPGSQRRRTRSSSSRTWMGFAR